MEKIDRRASVVPLAFNPESSWYIPIKFVNEDLTDFDLSSYDLELNVTDNDSQLTSLMPNGQVFEIVDCSRKSTTYDDNNNNIGFSVTLIAILAWIIMIGIGALISKLSKMLFRLKSKEIGL